MNQLHLYDRLLAQHREDLLREARHTQLIVAMEVGRKPRTSFLTPVRRQLGRWLVAWGMRLQAFPAELTQIEYRLQAHGGDCK